MLWPDFLKKNIDGDGVCGAGRMGEAAETARSSGRKV